jgi:hypothetical protein
MHVPEFHKTRTVVRATFPFHRLDGINRNEVIPGKWAKEVVHENAINTNQNTPLDNDRE